MLVLDFEVMLNVGFKIVDGLEITAFLRKLRVESWLFDFVDLFDENFKDRRLTGEGFLGVVLREGNVEVELIASRVTDNAVFKAGDKLAEPRVKW